MDLKNVILGSSSQVEVIFTLQDVKDFLVRFPFFCGDNITSLDARKTGFTLRDYCEISTTELDVRTAAVLLDFLKTVLVYQIESQIYVPLRLKLFNGEFIGSAYDGNSKLVTLDSVIGYKLFGLMLFRKIEGCKSSTVYHNANLIFEVNELCKSILT